MEKFYRSKVILFTIFPSKLCWSLLGWAVFATDVQSLSLPSSNLIKDGNGNLLVEHDQIATRMEGYLLLCWMMWRIWPQLAPCKQKKITCQSGRRREEAVKHLKHNKASGEDLLQIGGEVLEDLLLAWCSSGSRKKCRTNGQLASVWSDYKKSDTCNSCYLSSNNYKGIYCLLQAKFNICVKHIVHI